MLKTVLFGTSALDAETLKKDKKDCRKIGPCGIGKEALYLNSFYFSRRYYVRYRDIRRIFKRVAMSKGGYTGKGVFGSIPYLVVQTKDGREKQCNFKFEEQVDQILKVMEEKHPSIPTHSEKAEKKLRKAAEAEEKKYLKHLAPEANRTVQQLQAAEERLQKADYYKELSYAARQKRIQDNIRPSWRACAIVLFAAAIVISLFGLYTILHHRTTFSLVCLLGGLAAIALIAAVQVLPTGTKNRRAAEKDWQQALDDMRTYLSDETFPVPVQYAHPAVLERMIRIVREGRASTAEEALAVLKQDLQKLDHNVKVSQKEYDEITAIKPMFLICDYQ
ncbi:MAG: hypothetical protein LKE64_01535 [Solobacterium sp.]|jgi:hypothetical protein|nr:hypothetical protein [Solobacterium sp.]MCH4049878.1 hypothetical protein [Solobacterium sp.]MCH4073563.1 hypothetical protein [Solobacterium sp.]MCI1312934.1 hypothetical protein [Solobacterium sp.]MCI1345982.1 hypothetical protein [Solobacterium sp.]